MTVGELIKALSILNPNDDAVIADADEGMGSYLNIEEIVDETGFVSIGGNYRNRYEGPVANEGKCGEQKN